MKFLTNILRQLVLGPAYFTHLVLIKKSKHWSKKKVLDYKNENKILKNYITKSDIIKAGEEFVKRSPFLPLRKVRTGGTTGEPFVFFQDIFISRQKERAYLFDIWGHIGYKKFDYSAPNNISSLDKGFTRGYYQYTISYESLDLDTGI